MALALQSALTAVWHVGIAYTVGSVMDKVFGPLSTQDASTTKLVLYSTGQLGAGFIVLSELMGLLTDASTTPIGDGISSTAFIAAQPGLIANLARIRADLVPSSAPAVAVAVPGPVQQNA